MALVPPPSEVADIFSLTDLALSERYQFIEEIGFGNWGSVWLCRPKHPHSESDPETVSPGPSKVAVKLVHRSKTPTTAARLRSLWNEMKIVRSFKNDPHPSIIPFHSFIITPSYALITMAYLPALVPVEIPESRAKPWFLSLISAVAFLHARGVVHNDIKPANILLTASDPPVPVLVDFGFAEKYDPRSSKAFLSNLAYGTPEYLSPERARGLPHDTRKSDVWSLGVTLFEILRGRTPFEHAEPDGKTESFSTKAELEKYWARTVKGKWVGKWSMSKGLERLLRKMISPNADLRITAPVALNDSYFDLDKPEDPFTPPRLPLSPLNALEAEASRHIDIVSEKSGLSPPPSFLKTVATNNRHALSVKSRRGNNNVNKENADLVSDKKMNGHHRTQSARVISPSKAQPTDLSIPRNAAKKVTSFTTESCNNINHTPTSQSSVRPDIKGVLSVMVAKGDSNLVTSPNASHRASIITSSSFTSKENNNNNSNNSNNGKTPRTGTSRRVPARKPMPAVFSAVHKAKTIDVSTGDDSGDVSNTTNATRILVDLTKVISDEESETQYLDSRLFSSVKISGPLGPLAEVESPGLDVNIVYSPNITSGFSAIRKSIKGSFDKGVRLYKNSTLNSQKNNRSSSGLSVVAPELSRDNDSSFMQSNEDSKESWENDPAIRTVKSSLPTVRHAIRSEQLAADNRLDRMTIWIRNVERVVEDARASFAAGSMTPLPPLPPHSFQGSRRVGSDERLSKGSLTDKKDNSAQYTHRPRRRTVGSSPSEMPDDNSLNRKRLHVKIHDAPSTDPDHQHHQSNSISRPITPLVNLQLDATKEPLIRNPTRPPTRLSAIIDPNAFFIPKADDEDPEPSFALSERLRAVLTPVDPNIPPTVQKLNSPINNDMDYDEFLMASHSVRRVGKGYESNIITSNVVTNFKEPPFVKPLRDPNFFHSTTRRGEIVSPPLETPRKVASVNELGILSASQAAPNTIAGTQYHRRDEGNTSFSFMRRALKAITGGTVSRRLSKVL